MKTFLATLIMLVFLSAPVQAMKGTLFLLVDVSISMGDESIELQLESYAKAMEWVTPLENYNVEVILFGEQFEHISSGSRFNAANAFRKSPTIANRATCLNDALEYVEFVIETIPSPIVIDISGDGEENCDSKESVNRTLDRISQKREVYVNTLFIKPKRKHNFFLTDKGFEKMVKGAKEFYQSMLRGKGSFFYEVETFEHFEETLIRKVIKEIS